MSLSKNKITVSPRRLCSNICAVILLAVAVSCGDHKSVAGNYYDIDSLLNRQILLLLEKNASLEKNALMGGENSRIVFVPGDSATWAEELDIFRNLNVINKPVNRGAYKETIQKDRSSNLTVRSFEAQDEDLPIQRLQIFFLNVPADIRVIEAFYRESNVMYKTKRHLRMEFKKKDTKAVVSAYSVTGGQKMLLGDTVQYSVKAKISIPQH